jgi:hypothetical protein
MGPCNDNKNVSLVNHDTLKRSIYATYKDDLILK